ncbi:MAG: hypothetical protein JJT89_06295 [Nitriliruptoraceae bacterium]|nr:hypothetical protein [Nitriliruptoraceae bacterium]
MSTAGLVLVLDGPLAVGRSTTLAALQRSWPQVRQGPLLAAGLDAMLGAFGPARRRWSELVLPEVASTGGEAAAAWGPLGRELIVGMHRAAAAWAHQGTDVVLDHVLLDRATVADLDGACAGLAVVTIGLECDPDVLESRAHELGWSPAVAVAQARTARGIVAHDRVFDTTETSTDELVDLILDVVAERMRG